MIHINRPRWPGEASRPTTLAAMRERMQHFRSDESSRRADETLALATDVLISMHKQPNKKIIPKCVSEFNKKRIINEVQQIIDWYFPLKDISLPSKKEQAEFKNLWLDLIPLAWKSPPL